MSISILIMCQADTEHVPIPHGVCQHPGAEPLLEGLIRLGSPGELHPQQNATFPSSISKYFFSVFHPLTSSNLFVSKTLRHNVVSIFGNNII